MASARIIEDSIIIVLLEFSIKKLTKKHPDILKKILKIIKNREEKNKELI